MLRHFNFINSKSPKKHLARIYGTGWDVFYREASTTQTTATVANGPHAKPASKRDATIDTSDFKSAFQFRKTSEITRSVFVFKLCSYETLVTHSMQLMAIGRRVLGKRLFHRLMKSSFYGQFVAGETTSELKKASMALQKVGIGPMLCVPIEEDAGTCPDVDDRYNTNLNSILNCVTLSKAVDPNYPMIQLKLTALLPGELCATLSRKMPDPLTNPTYIDLIMRALDGEAVELGILDSHDNLLLAKSLKRLQRVGESAVSLGVRVLIDAEYTYLNPALRLVSLCMMLKYNTQRPLVSYTYQNYLKETFDILRSDVEFIRSRDSCFAAKLVRGAYMEKERKMAVDKGIADPVHDTFDDTSNMYHTSMEYLFDNIQRDPNAFYVVVASHNEATVQRAIQQMKTKDIKPNNGSVFFGQLYGMSDHLSSAIGQAGYCVYKSMPYGPVDVTLSYLYRRALENRSVLGGTSRERTILWKALVDRITFGRFPRKAAT